MAIIAIIGAGQIGQAVHSIITALRTTTGPLCNIHDVFIFDANQTTPNVLKLDFADTAAIADTLRDCDATHVVNAGPFFFNENVATAAASAGCHYLDFTEDDVMSAKVQAIYVAKPHLSCATKCGLAPGFINYIGHSVVSRIAKPTSLMVSVGALPRNVNYDASNPAEAYSLSWSVDGLVNEYIRPCHARIGGVEVQAKPLSRRANLVIDGVAYETALTSGGVGSLITDLAHVPTVYYSTIRYPSHYDYVIAACARHNNDFDLIKAEFLSNFAFTRDDVIVTYAEAKGYDAAGKYVRETFAQRYVGLPSAGLTGIQATTASSGVAVLEMMLGGNISGIVTHSSITLDMLSNTEAFKYGYKKA